MADGAPERTDRSVRSGGERLLYLTDDRLRQGIEMLFFAYRSFTSDPDRILAEYGLGRAHHRALHFIGRHPDISVANLVSILGVTKQSLNRVLGDLVERGIVVKRVGDRDRRNRLLILSDFGRKLDQTLADVQRRRVRRAFKAAGADAVVGFQQVLENLIDDEEREAVLQIIQSGQVR